MRDWLCVEGQVQQAGSQDERLLEEHTDAGRFAGADMGKTGLEPTLL